MLFPFKVAPNINNYAQNCEKSCPFKIAKNNQGDTELLFDTSGHKSGPSTDWRWPTSSMFSYDGSLNQGCYSIKPHNTYTDTINTLLS